MYKWTEAFPGRLEAELAAFESDERLDFELDSDTYKTTGRVVLRGALTHNGDEVALDVVYPESFPYLRPEVFAPELNLHRHQNPHEGNLCLLDRSTRAWIPSDMAAWLVAERVPLLLDALAKGDEAIADVEVPQGEPASVYYESAPGAIVFVPTDFLKMSTDQVAGHAKLAIGESERGVQLLRACLSRVAVRGRKGRLKKLASISDERVRNRFPDDVYDASWARLERLPHRDGSPDEVIAAAKAVEGFRVPPWQETSWGRMRITAVVFSEEIQQGIYGDDWLVAVEVETNDGSTGSYFAQVDRLSAEDLQSRIPELVGLQDKSVALAGLGAIGAPTALELAQSQIGELRILDSDLIDTGTAVRWPRGLHAAGHRKTSAIEGTIQSDYPYTHVVAHNHRIGRVAFPREDDPPSDSSTVEEFLNGADLVIDTTAELGVQQFLAAQATAQDIPQVFAWMTEGGWGGAVARVVPGQTGCWLCLQLHFADGSIPLPPRDETGHAQPRGCSTPTFTGPSFAALPISAQAARVASRTLLQDSDGLGDVFICDQHPSRGAPEWSSFPLERHPRCDCSADTGDN